ncbi:FN3 associated domain-containing protein [Thiocapsa sp.]|uniref:FN3 associated domain-containing protein n=1 Tax=Thiocapsa sp. TaxID=2024551 RepID=UPI0035946539
MKLRATPLNGDTVYVEIGAPATTASQRLSGRDYETAEMVVSFLAVDSTGQHETGETFTWHNRIWHNRITIKSRVYDRGADKVVELRTAPPAPMRYTTDGSDPKVAGGAYNEPVVLPAGTRFVLAVAEGKGSHSEVHHVAVNWNQPVDAKPIDTAAPATWTPVSHPEKVFRFNTTQAAYGFIERLKKHAGKAAAQRIAVLDGRWADLQLADDLLLDSEQIRATVEHLRGLVMRARRRSRRPPYGSRPDSSSSTMSTRLPLSFHATRWNPEVRLAASAGEANRIPCIDRRYP